MGRILRIDGQRDVIPKGTETPMRIYEVGGIAGPYNMALEEKTPGLVTLVKQIPARLRVLDGKGEGGGRCGGIIKRLSKRAAEMDLEDTLEPLTNVKMNLLDVEEELGVRNIYGKIIERYGEKGRTHLLRFTSVPPEAAAYFHAHRQHGA